MAMHGRVVEQHDGGKALRIGFDFFWRGAAAQDAGVAFALEEDIARFHFGTGAPLNGLGGAWIVAPSENDLVGTFGGAVFGEAENIDQLADVAGGGEGLDEGDALQRRGDGGEFVLGIGIKFGAVGQDGDAQLAGV